MEKLESELAARELIKIAMLYSLLNKIVHFITNKLFQRVNYRLENGEGADQHRDGARQHAAEVGLHRPG